MKIGICGGTFDPFHRGHLDPILAVRERMEWDRVLYIPAFVQPFKTDRRTASPFHRYAMAVLGTAEHEFLHVSSRELERGAVSYTVDTLRELRGEFPDATLDWIIGDDNLDRLDEWRSPEILATLANFAVLARAEVSPNTRPSRHFRLAEPGDRPPAGAIVHAGNAAVPVSSTEIRRRIGEGEPFEELVPAPVSRYIHHYGLYRKGHS